MHRFHALAAIWLVACPLFLAADEPKTKAPPKHTNRLAKETSPYLLQHSHNPVDWHAWGEEALAKAKKEGKLIFLSIGYSSCHWCHVMERESFHDEEIAAFLNKHFVCIKVDREERPDIDQIYMTALSVYHQLAGEPRGGGWPLSMFLTPEADPFVGGTYFPARDGDRQGAPGFLTIVTKVQEIWGKSPDKIREDAKTVARFTKAEMEGRKTPALVALDEALVAPVQEALDEQYDPKYGGFGYGPNPRQPKFPEPSNLVFLLDRASAKNADRDKSERAKEMLLGTLTWMSLGGIRDHLGGGFHRYSVDRYWQIPHFEKMLYDNGQLAGVYAQAHAVSGREDLARISREICDFLLREMADPAGGFVTAFDADSEGEEGKFYRWDKAEVQKLLTADEFSLFASVYGLDGDPNFEEKFYVPQLAQPLAEIAAEKKLTEAELEKQLAPIRQKLLAVRAKRVPPLVDTKLLAADNGLAIGGLADAGRILKEPRYIAAAEKAADFVLTKLRDDSGRLKRTYSAGQARLNAYVSDYAFVTDGLIKLHAATGDKKWLTAADELTQKQIELFADGTGGGFFFTSSDHEALLARGKEIVDTAVPSSNSVSADNLIRLAVLQGKSDYLPRASKTILAAAATLQSSPSSAPRMAAAVPALLEARATLGKPK
ncbi:MAG: thioredoxin domain-containing protein [Planctomycetaceae bacterium]|nr:thioredoxin domain-containing protein [Planctomycetaceae bacterium]